MTRAEASLACRNELNAHGLHDWSVRYNTNSNSHFLGMCVYRDKCIILSAHHVDIHPDPDIINTIKHEVAHALTPGHGHDTTWQDKAREIGCDNTSPCSNLSLNPTIIDAIRSGATVEVTFDEQVIRTPKYTVTRLQDKCDICGKVAKTKSEQVITNDDEVRPDMKLISLECGHTLVKYIRKGTPFHKYQMGGDAACKHEWVKNNCVLCDRKKPFPFQLEGMKKAEAALSVGNGFAFFDEMGLGKTVQASAITYFMQDLVTPTLWVVKSGLKYQTAVHLINWNGSDHVPQIIESSKDFLIPGLKHYIIGYDMMVEKTRVMKKSGKEVKQGFDITKFDKIGIKCVVLDECQQIKNADSSRTQMVRKVVKGRKVIGMSGSPWNNRGDEFYPILNMLDHMKFPSEKAFVDRYVDFYWQGQFRKMGGLKRIPEFKELIKDICIRRERKEVMPELPLVNRTKLNVKMTPQDEALYDEAVDNFITWYEEQAANISGMAILAQMAKMRHLVAIAKLPATYEFVDEFVEETDRKIVIFAHHIEVQEMLHTTMMERYGDIMPVFKIVGGMRGSDSLNICNSFNEAPRAILVASELAAGEGLNLQTCSDCVMHERQWNPAKEEQAEGRFIRIGSTATSVNATYAHLEGETSTDPTMDATNERKRRQYHAGMNEGEMPQWNQDSFAKELAETIINAHRAKKGRK